MRFKIIIAVASYALTIPAANWMIGHIGYCNGGPCVIPVGFGLVAPSGVLMIGAALALRDLVHEIGGLLYAVFAIVIGASISALIAPPELAAASLAAFLISEVLDLIVYTPIRGHNRPLAILASGLVGSIADSAAFLLIAFGSLDFLSGQVVGKFEVTAFAATVAYVASNLRVAKKFNQHKKMELSK